jgi:hypothetical protein
VGYRPKELILKIRKLKSSPLLFVVAALLCSLPTSAQQFVTPLQKQRLEVLAAGQKGAAGIPILTTAMKSPDALMRRAAVRSLSQIGVAAHGALRQALKTDGDVLVRRTALRALATMGDGQLLPLLEAVLSDDSELVRASAVEVLAQRQPRTPPIEALLKRAQNDKSHNVSHIAAQSLWPAALQVEGVSLRVKPEWKDSQLSVVKTIPLALDAWRFQTDVGQIGHTQYWFAPASNDGDWKVIAIGKAWEEAAGITYDGVAWYRNSFALPEKPQQSGTDLVFDAVDESAWVWINGHFVGRHDIGPDGWDKRFAMDVTPFLKWGETNQITVRVLDRTLAGGIWKPVYFEVLKR